MVRPERREFSSKWRWERVCPGRARPDRIGARGGIIAKLLFLIFLLLLLGIAYLFRGPLLRSLGHWWIVSEDAEKAQVIAVCGGDNAQGERVRKAVELYRAGWAEWLLLSGATYRTYLPEVELMKREAVGAGVPADRVVTLSSGGVGTMEEIRQMKALLMRHGWKRVLLVSPNYGARRVRIVARKILGDADIAFCVVAAPDSEFPPDHWWQTRTGRGYLWREIQGAVWTYLRLALGKGLS